MIKTYTSKLDCGCEYKESRKQEGHNWCISSELIKECKQHKKIRLKKEKEAEEFKKFPSQLSKEIYNELEAMINKLDDAGVNIVNFPHEAEIVLKETAIRLSNSI